MTKRGKEALGGNNTFPSDWKGAKEASHKNCKYNILNKTSEREL